VLDSAGPAGEALRRTGLDRASIEAELIEARRQDGARRARHRSRRGGAIRRIGVRTRCAGWRRTRPPSPPFGPPAKRALEQSLREALRLRQREIGAALEAATGRPV
jgi:hypothetical protein